MCTTPTLRLSQHLTLHHKGEVLDTTQALIACRHMNLIPTYQWFVQALKVHWKSSNLHLSVCLSVFLSFTLSVFPSFSLSVLVHLSSLEVALVSMGLDKFIKRFSGDGWSQWSG